MLSERNMAGSTQAKPAILSGRGKIGHSIPGTGKPNAGMLDTGMMVFPMVGRKLSNAFLARHLADVALLAKSQGDVRMAEHLVDVAYDLATET